MRLLSLATSLSLAAAATLIPGPSGPYSVALKVQTFEDPTRWDPYAPADQPEKRRVLASVFLPVNQTNCTAEVVPYMPPATAASMDELSASLGLTVPLRLFSDMEMEFCRLGQSCGPKHSYPLVLFSPGRFGTRLAYNVMARSLASHGYVVVAMDHTYDTGLIEFPDGSVAAGVNFTNTDLDWVEGLVENRQKDMSFLIDQLTDPTVSRQLLAGTSISLDPERIFAFGHSLGGAASAAALLADGRVAGALNFDGMMVGPVTREGADRTLALVGIADEIPRDLQLPSWNETWSRLRGPGLMVAINGTTHMSFIDAPQLPTVQALPAEYAPAIAQILGTIDGFRIGELMVDLVMSVMDFVFDGDAEGFCNVEGLGADVDQLGIRGVECA